MIRTMVYVGCDECGDPIGGTNGMADDAREARVRARNAGAARIRRNGMLVDLCHRCKPDSRP